MPVPEEIKRAFASGATILTASVRAARWLQREYALLQRSSGRRMWATPAIEDWDTWLRGLWQEQALADADAPLLLTSLQERSVWTRMQREDAALLVSPASMAALAESAYALLSDYEAHSERNHVWGKTDAERFRQWAAKFDRECARRDWMPGAGLEAKLSTSLNPKALPKEILLLGFDRTTPAQDSLLNAIAAYSVRVEFANPTIDPQIKFACADGLCEEITACARWARSQVEKKPEARIGILVPDMSAMRSEIERTFRRVLMPQTDDIFAAQPMPFEFSLGQPLAHVPVIRAALLILRWLRVPLREEEVAWLLLSGFLSSNGAEYLAFAKLDAKRRNAGSLSLEISLPDFLKQSATSRLPSLEKLASLHRAAIANRVADEDRLPGRWADLAQSFLRDVGWPGSAARDTLHFQALRRWERALDEITLLGFDGQRVGYDVFLPTLESHALETIFSPESQGAPVQIMGALESSGQQFDALWFLSADDESWPQHGRPHPLLPNEVQRRFCMPYSDPASDLELAKAVTARIAASAREVVFSHAQRNHDGELRPSPLLPQNAQWRDVEPLLDKHEAGDLETVDEAVEVAAWPQGLTPGGSDVLKAQAACAFQAFATKRLRADALNRSEWGLTAAQRGVLLHTVLERIWSPETGALHSLGDLLAAIYEARLGGVLNAAIASAFAEYDAVEDVWMRAYLTSEKRRLHTRLTEWMEVEAARIPFEVIACEEKLNDVHVGGLRLKLRADRIDQLANFDRLLIDYKSSEVSRKDWHGLRPDEPQLPLYAVFGGVADVRGVLFAQIRAGDMGFVGSVVDVKAQMFADTKPDSALGKEPYSEEMRDGWEQALLNLAGDFLRGDAAVNPKDGKKTCEYCALQGLCRVAEMRNSLEEGAEESDGDE